MSANFEVWSCDGTNFSVCPGRAFFASLMPSLNISSGLSGDSLGYLVPGTSLEVRWRFVVGRKIGEMLRFFFPTRAPVFFVPHLFSPTRYVCVRTEGELRTQVVGERNRATFFWEGIFFAAQVFLFWRTFRQSVAAHRLYTWLLVVI